MTDNGTRQAGRQGALATEIYGRLKADILSLRVRPRTTLQEIELGERYGASRTPVREALRQLLDEGLVERNGRFYQVTELSQGAIRDLYEVREALETTAVRLCIERADQAAMAKLAAIVESQVAALAREDLTGFSELDSQFHLGIAEASQNDFLLRQLAATHDKVRLARGHEVAKPGWVERVVVEHRRILSALHRRNAAVADAEMRYHLNSVVRLHLGLPQQPIEMLD